MPLPPPSCDPHWARRRQPRLRSAIACCSERVIPSINVQTSQMPRRARDALRRQEQAFSERSRDNRFARRSAAKFRNYVIREQEDERFCDVMTWVGQAAWPMTNVRNLKLSYWKRLAKKPENRLIGPLPEFAGFTPEEYDLGDGKPRSKGEVWFSVTDQPTFAVAGFWQHTASCPASPW